MPAITWAKMVYIYTLIANSSQHLHRCKFYQTDAPNAGSTV